MLFSVTQFEHIANFELQLRAGLSPSPSFPLSSSPTPLSLLPHLLFSPSPPLSLSPLLSLLSRLCGLTPIIRTDCGHPTELLLWANVPYTMILNPIFILVLFWLLATDLRMWLFTPVSFCYMLYLRLCEGLNHKTT